ncbi:16S rRNA (guanine(527)-N(7))-methyltransferase RsmG [Thiobacter aerophilum]|uniref:Ribosomal RNA small subunit methyltransferase G n=1 Tax=Thiobacter aerophilum TaxID=3121275 RepID=A0ABV0ED00_9BURK
MNVASLEDTLHLGAAELGVALLSSQEAKLIAYLELLLKWNKVYNLTAVREPQAMVTQHLLDSLSVLPHLGEVATLVDVGAGAGLPGIPLAIARPQLKVVLADASHKKTSFMQQALLELALPNASVRCERVERLRLSAPADAVICRAFADLKEFARLARHLVAPGGRLLAMKGLYPHEELLQLPPEVVLRDVIPLRVPGLAAQRHLVVMEVR